MKCPIDHTVLVMTERQGVEIDYCPSCRGIWLDRGELDKLLDRAAAQLAPAAASAPGTPVPPPGEEVPEGGGQPYPAYGADPTGASFGPYARRESWLSELLDID